MPMNDVLNRSGRLLNAYVRMALIPVGTGACFLLMFTVFRVILALQHGDLLTHSNAHAIAQSFLTGVRFDLRVTCIALLPVIFIPLINTRLYRLVCTIWLTCLFSGFVLLSIMELEFYREFAQRLNILVVQYLKEDPATVLAMIWQGFPIVQYVAFWIVASAAGYYVIRTLLAAAFTHNSRTNTVTIAETNAVTNARHHLSVLQAIPLIVILLITDALLARGTLRGGPPLRWGDAYHSDVMFLNHLALNGIFTFSKALLDQDQVGKNAKWSASMADDMAISLTRGLVLGEADQLIETGSKVLLRTTHASQERDKPLNVVVVLMESFSGQFVGTLGNENQVTPEFDELAERGVLFTRAFSNGTHTHQGTFATFSCFPNLPGHEYLMQQREGMNHFSGLSAVLSEYASVFLYNGDFSWDNQKGFFTNQGIDRFIGRFDYVNPVFEDDVWGVSDEDMFNRAVVELDSLAATEKPFIAYLQTLSNHLPYSTPPHDELSPVAGPLSNGMSDRLTAMKYSDWALGEFFRTVTDKPWYRDTIFVVLGDHGFGTSTQLTEINLLRFHVPLLFLAPGLDPARLETIASQVDVVPTILGLLGSTAPQQCWGRNLLGLDPTDPGFAMIKPSGSEPTTALVKGNDILTFDHEIGAHIYTIFHSRPEPVVSDNSNDALKSFPLPRNLKPLSKVPCSALKTIPAGTASI